MTDELLDYYNDELSSLYEMADDFSQTFPKIAGRLRLGASGSDDPHVERLIQAFAFLSARTRKKLDDDFPEIAEAMLEVLYPQQLAPVPSMSVVELELSSDESQLTGGYRIPKATPLISEPVGDETCTYRTAWPLTLWPLRVDSARLLPPPFGIPSEIDDAASLSMLRLSLNSASSETSLNQLEALGSLRFFLNGQRQYIFDVYELLANHVAALYVSWTDGENTEFRKLSPEQLCPVGFDENEELLPVSSRVPRSIQLLREYFTFPQRFLFLELRGLDSVLPDCDSSNLQILVFLNRRIEHIERFVSRESFRLGCTPVVNLFPVTCEPVRMTHEHSEYRIVPDSRQPASHEIYTVDRVSTLRDDGSAKDIAPLYSIQHADEDDAARHFWIANRRPAVLRNGVPDSGTEVSLSFVDLDLNPQRDTGSILNIEALCLNRDLPSLLPYGGGSPKFSLNDAGPVENINCLLQPTPTRRPALRDAVVWRLVTQLSLNYLQVTGGEEAARTLREHLKVHDKIRSSDDPFPFDGIVSVSSKRIVSRILPDSAIYDSDRERSSEPGFARGLEITVELDEQKFVGIGAFLFASVLERFFALHCSLNSFTSTVLRTRQRKEIRRWPPRTGEKRL